MSRGTRRTLNVLLVILVLVALWVTIRVCAAWREIETLACAASSYACGVGPSGPDDGRCAGYWDEGGEFHYLRDDGVWVH